MELFAYVVSLLAIAIVMGSLVYAAYKGTQKAPKAA